MGTYSCSAGDAVSPWPAWGSLDPCLHATSPRKEDKGKGLVCSKCQCCTETSLFPCGSTRTKPFPASSLKHSVLICEIKSGSASAVVICHKLQAKSMPASISRCAWLLWSSWQTESGVTPRHGRLSPTSGKIFLLFLKARSAVVLGLWGSASSADEQLPAGSDAAERLPLRTSRHLLNILFFACVHLQCYRRVCAELHWRADEDYYIAGAFFPRIFEKATQNYIYKRQHLLQKPGPGKLLL